MIKNILITAALFFGVNAHAGMIFNPSVFYFHNAEEQGTSKAESTTQVLNFKLGYGAASGLYLGATYDMENRDYGSSDSDRKSLGASIGYLTGGWQFLGTYFVTSDLEKMEGSGYAVEIGYVFKVGSIGIGPLLSYRHWEYDKNDGVSMAEKFTQTNIYPSVQFQFTF